MFVYILIGAPIAPLSNLQDVPYLLHCEVPGTWYSYPYKSAIYITMTMNFNHNAFLLTVFGHDSFWMDETVLPHVFLSFLQFFLSGCFVSFNTFVI